jgi:hypothetical protein
MIPLDGQTARRHPNPETVSDTFDVGDDDDERGGSDDDGSVCRGSMKERCQQ